MHLSPTLQHRLAEALASASPNHAYAAAFELRDSLVPVYRVQSSIEGIAAFNQECGQFDYVLFTSGLSALVLCSASGDYIMVAGAPPFVEAVTGSKLSEVRAAFHDYAEDPAFTSSERTFYLSLLAVLCETYPSIIEGSWVTFPSLT